MSNIDKKTTLWKPGSKECSHVWKISDYSAKSKQPNEKLRSVKFSATDDDFSWCLEHTVYQLGNRTIVSIGLRPECCDDLRKCESVDVDLDICITEPDADASTFRVRTEASFTLKYDVKFSGTLPGIDIVEIQRFILRDDELLIRCNFTYCIARLNLPIISEYRILSDVEKCFVDDHFRDVTISVKGKEYRAHKLILATRCSVFDKMLRVDMSESKNNHIDIADMEQDIFEEIFYYIYTGKVKNLNELALELLPVADRYDLEELKMMCGEVLRKKLSTENAVDYLILADTHRAEELKHRTLQLIKKNYENFKDFNDKEKWKSLATSHPHLLKDMLDAFHNVNYNKYALKE